MFPVIQPIVGGGGGGGEGGGLESMKNHFYASQLWAEN